MITKAHINEVNGGFELHFSERFPYKEQPVSSWVDFKKTLHEAKQIAMEAHSLHIIKLVEDLRNELEQIGGPILKPLTEQLNSILDDFLNERYLPNHRQLCKDVVCLEHYMCLVTPDRANLIATELMETVNYELSTDLKKWVLD